MSGGRRKGEKDSPWESWILEWVAWRTCRHRGSHVMDSVRSKRGVLVTEVTTGLGLSRRNLISRASFWRERMRVKRGVKKWLRNKVFG